MSDRDPFDDSETAASVLAALAVVCLLAGVVILARDRCLIQMPTIDGSNNHGSPTLID